MEQLGNDELCETARAIRILSTVVAKIARQDLEQHLENGGFDIRAVQYLVMRILSGQALTLADVSRRMNVDPSTLVPVIDELERKGQLRRGRDPRDRRRTPISMTPEGEELLTRSSQLDENSKLVMGLRAMGQEQSQHLLELLTRFVTYIADRESLEFLAHCSIQVSPQLSPIPYEDSQD